MSILKIRNGNVWVPVVALKGNPTDVQINGSSIVSDNIANIPMAKHNRFGVVKADYGEHYTSIDTHHSVDLSFEAMIAGRASTYFLATTDLASTTSRGLMSKADKIKLDGIAAGAGVNVQSDWNEADTDSDAYILNKPDIPESLSTDIK